VFSRVRARLSSSPDRLTVFGQLHPSHIPPRCHPYPHQIGGKPDSRLKLEASERKWL
jgi:hypothetical protein